MYNIEKDIKQFELTVEGGKLDGCLVYHEAVKDFIVGLLHNQNMKEDLRKQIQQIIEDYGSAVDPHGWGIDERYVAIEKLVNLFHDFSSGG